MKWQKPTPSNLKRNNFLFNLLAFSETEHLEMLNLTHIRKLIPISLVKLGLQKATFINFSIKEKSKNMHLAIDCTPSSMHI